MHTCCFLSQRCMCVLAPLSPASRGPLSLKFVVCLRGCLSSCASMGILLCRALLADACRHYVALDSTCDVISFRRRCKLCSISSICFYFSWRFLGKAICFYCPVARHARDVHSLPLVSLASGRLLHSVLHGQLVSHVRNFMLRC